MGFFPEQHGCHQLTLPSTKAWVGPLWIKVIQLHSITELIHTRLEEIDSCFPMRYVHYFPLKPVVDPVYIWDQNWKSTVLFVYTGKGEH